MTRFSRQEILIGTEGQEQLKRSTVCIIGLGALGSVGAELLTRAGVGNLILIDYDVVEESNLQRQALYETADVGALKVDAAKEHLENIWPEVNIITVPHYLSFKTLELLEQVDVVFDGTDNMETRFLLNEYCKKNQIPIIFTSAVVDRGNVLVVDTKDKPCYHCAFAGKHSDEDCGTVGVYSASTRTAATIASNEALKLLLGKKKEVLQGLFSFNVTANRFDTFALKKKDNCKVCKGEYEILEQKKSFSVRFCNSVQGYRADPLANSASQNKLVGKTAENGLKKGSIDGHEVWVSAAGSVFFPKLKDADIAKRLAEKLVE